MSIKYYRLANDEELPDEFCAVRDMNGEPSEYTFYVHDAKEDKLREYITRLEQANLVLDGDNCDLRNDMRDMQCFVDENRKLRKLAVLQSVIIKHMSICPTTDCHVCPVNDECAESVYLEGVLGMDNKETSWLVQQRCEGTKIKGCVWVLAIDGEIQWDKMYTSSLPALESAMDTIFENNLCGQETNRWLTAPKALPDILPNVYSWNVCTIEDGRIVETNIIRVRRITVVGKGCWPWLIRER